MNLLARASSILALALASFLAVGASPAWAHDVLVDQNPAEGEVLPEAPDRISLTFNNSLLDIGEGATIINVLDAAGVNLTEDQHPTLDGLQTVQLLPELPDGAYRVMWRVVSSDGHPITGTFAFAVGADGQKALDALPPIGHEGDSSEHSEDHSHEAGSKPSTPVIIVASIGVIAAAALGAILFLRKVKGPSGPSDPKEEK